MRARLEALPTLSIVLLWIALGAGLAVFTSRIADWFVMTDELLYERLAISIAHSHSPFPHVHQAAIANINQLYPLVIAPVFRHGAVLHGFHEAHVLNAFVMSSAAIPAYLLARRVTGSRWLPYVVAVATVTVPWIVLSSFLLTEVAAYPGVRVGRARDAGLGRAAVGAERPPRGRGHRAGGARANAVLRARGRASRSRFSCVPRASDASAPRCASTARWSPRTPSAALAALGLVAAGHGLLGTYCDDRAREPAFRSTPGGRRPPISRSSRSAAGCCRS